MVSSASDDGLLSNYMQAEEEWAKENNLAGMSLYERLKYELKRTFQPTERDTYHAVKMRRAFLKDLGIDVTQEAAESYMDDMNSLMDKIGPDGDSMIEPVDAYEEGDYKKLAWKGGKALIRTLVMRKVSALIGIGKPYVSKERGKLDNLPQVIKNYIEGSRFEKYVRDAEGFLPKKGNTLKDLGVDGSLCMRKSLPELSSIYSVEIGSVHAILMFGDKAAQLLSTVNLPDTGIVSLRGEEIGRYEVLA